MYVGNIMKSSRRILYLFIVFSGFVSCNFAETKNKLINTEHLDYLYEDISIDGKDMAIIHIYSEYPDYKYVGDQDEGIACIDDAARAALFYLEYYHYTMDEDYLTKNKKLLKFILHLQAENGYFYNFIWPDYSINKSFKTSVAEPDWWSWRALWVLSESYSAYVENDKEFADEIWNSIERILIPLKNQIPQHKNLIFHSGIELPTWLQKKYASDQTSVLLLGLINYYKYSKDETVYNYIQMLCEGIRKMQVRNKDCKFNGVFLSWENTWHAWGNSQSYALLKAFKLLKDDNILSNVRLELNNFYPILYETGYLNYFTISKDDSVISINNEEKFSQIAYNIRPIVYSLLEAYEISGDKMYAELAGKIAKWFIGKNPFNGKIYDEKTGIIFDGILSEKEVNRNSGAESTIEGLLTLLRIVQNKIALNEFESKL